MNGQTGSSLVLIVDDDGDAMLSLVRALKAAAPELTVQGSTTAEQAIAQIQATAIDVAVIDLHLDRQKGVESGFQLLSEIRKLDPAVRPIVLTGHGSLEYGVRALNDGAASFLEKPPEVGHLVALIRDGVKQCQLRRAYAELAAQPTHTQYYFVGVSPQAQRVRESISYAARTGQAVLLFGETGTGKGLVARSIHEQSGREKFVRYQPNFATFDLVNSELFGHVKGAFTGAVEARAGLLREADGGTIFLDEIDELPLEVQVTLLGVLQDRTYRPVGSNREESVEARIICATNRDPDQAVKERKLRPDLYHRLAHLRINIPPLRDRREDIPSLVQNFTSILNSRKELSISSINEEAVGLLRAHSWPGNVRELEAVVEGAAYRAQFRGSINIEATDIDLGHSNTPPTAGATFHQQVEAYKAQLIEQTLEKNNGNLLRTAEQLGLDRTSLRRMLKRTRGQV